MLQYIERYFAALFLLALFAFWPNYLAKPFPSSDGYTHFHAAMGTAWMLLLIVQPWAIRTQRRNLHRALGKCSWLLAPLFVVSGVLLASFRFTSMDEARFKAETAFLFLPVHTIVLFALCYALGIVYRRNAAAHGRFMACTALPMIDPVIGRVIGIYFPPLPSEWMYQAITFSITDAFALVLAFTYRGPTGAKKALIAVVVAFVFAHTLWFTFVRSDAWLAFASWFRSLPLTALPLT